MTENDVKQCKKAKGLLQTDKLTDQQTDRVGGRVACTRLRTHFKKVTSRPFD